MSSPAEDEPEVGVWTTVVSPDSPFSSDMVIGTRKTMLPWGNGHGHHAIFESYYSSKFYVTEFDSSEIERLKSRPR